MPHTTISTDAELRDCCRRLADQAWLAFDTEFVSEYSYRPVLCLVQVGAPDELLLIDAIAIDDMTPFWQMLVEREHETIVHAGRGELEFCIRSVGGQPSRLFDIQLAAGLIGIEYPAGLGTLVSKVLGKRSNKGETRTDWRRRPLSNRQIQYALEDVLSLPPIRNAIHASLEKLGRLGWFDEEMAAWQREVDQSINGQRWRRLSGNSGLDRRSLAIIRELWGWRESEAERRDCPVRRVLRDDLIVELAKRKTADPERIKAVRGLDRGDLKRRMPVIAAAIQRALALDDNECPEKRQRRGHSAKMSVLGQFLFAALGSECRRVDLAPALVGTPNDIRALIAYRANPDDHARPPRLAQGWRAEIVGRLFDDLLDGKIAVRVADPLSDSPLAFELSDGT